MVRVVQARARQHPDIAIPVSTNSPAVDGATSVLDSTRSPRREQWASSIRSKWREVFGIDLRSLAAFRVGLGLAVIADVTARSWDLVALYTDQGVLPGGLLLATDGRGVYFSAHYWAGVHPAFQAALFLFSAACAVALIAGWRTRLATLACWYLVASVQIRQPFAYLGGDSILRLMLFWGLFLPLGARFSVDGLRGRTPPRRNQHVSGATVALLLQVCFIYWATGIQKTGELWWNGQAVAYALRADEWVTPFGVWLRDFPAVLTVFTDVTLAVEIFGPFLAFVAFWTPGFRLLTVALFWGFHAGLATTMNIGLFPLFAMVAWLPFVPGTLWERLNPDPTRAATDLPDPGSPATSAAALVVLTYIALLLGQRTALLPRVLPEQVEVVGKALRVQQAWVMFAPNPSRTSARYELRLTMADGSRRSEPAAPSVRMMHYMQRITEPPLGATAVRSLRYFAACHCASRDDRGDPSQQLERLELVKHVRPLDDAESIELHTQVLVDFSCRRPGPSRTAAHLPHQRPEPLSGRMDGFKRWAFAVR